MTDIQAQAGTPDPVDDAMRYLLDGGLFNPELMNHDQVRDLVMRLRDEVIAERKVCDLERAAAERCAKGRYDALRYLKHNAQTLADLIRQSENRHSLDDDVLAGINPGDYAHKVKEKLQRPLLSFIETIEATGGVNENLEPAADEDWQDLGEAYAEACSALGVPMKQTKEEE